MNSNIFAFVNSFHMRGIISDEQLLKEMLRVKLTARSLKLQEKFPKDEDELFGVMKQSTEDTILGYFPGDRGFFSEIYTIAQKIDLIEFALDLYKNNRLKQMFSPASMMGYICKLISEVEPQSILITEAEKSLLGLKELVELHRSRDITLISSNPLIVMLLQLEFEGYRNISILNQSIYRELLINKHFDFIYSVPDFGVKIEDAKHNFISSKSDIVATQNLLGYLSDKGMLVTVLPANIAFAGGSEAKFRNYVMTQYHLEGLYSLPEGFFKPYSGIKTYMLKIGAGKKNEVKIGYLRDDNGLHTDKVKILRTEDAQHGDWQIELLLSDDENIKKFKASVITKVKLNEVAEVFRGKSILKKNLKPGKIKVLNLSNITDKGIDYFNMESIDEEERKIKPYELTDGDVILSCRGTTIKTGVYRKQDSIVIASANVIVIRPRPNKILSDYLKIFFESPVGIALIKSIQRGTIVINLNPSDIMEMEIPLLSIEEQEELVKEYEKEAALYYQTVSEAEKRFLAEKEKIYNRLV